MRVTRSARLFLEREGLVPTLRGPVPRFRPSGGRIDAYPVAIPLPHPARRVGSPGEPPDGGPGGIWPHPGSEEPRTPSAT